MTALSASHWRLLLVVTAFSIVSLSSPQCKEPQKATTDQQNTAPRQDAGAPSPVQLPAIPSGVQPSTTEHSTKYDRKPGNWADKAWEHWGHQFFTDLKLTDVLVALFTGLVAFYTARLQITTARLWRTSQEQARHTEAATELTRRQVDLTEASVKNVERGYLFISQMHQANIDSVINAHPSQMEAIFMSPPFPVVGIILKNHGRSPVNIVTGGVFINIEQTIPVEITAESVITAIPAQATEPIEIVISAGQEASIGQFQSASQSFTVDNIKGILADRVFVYCHGWITYRDIFMDQHTTTFCRKYVRGTAQFVPDGGYERNHGT